MIRRRISEVFPAIHSMSLSAFAIGTAMHAGCTQPQDDGTREDNPYYRYDSSVGGDAASPADNGCHPAPAVVILQTPEPPPSCAELCQSKGMKCNDHGIAAMTTTPISTFPYTEGPSCHYAGREVRYSCSSCYSGSDYTSCDDSLRWSTRNYKSGPYAGTYCACSP